MLGLSVRSLRALPNGCLAISHEALLFLSSFSSLETPVTQQVTENGQRALRPFLLFHHCSLGGSPLLPENIYNQASHCRAVLVVRLLKGVNHGCSTFRKAVLIGTVIPCFLCPNITYLGKGSRGRMSSFQKRLALFPSHRWDH